MTEETLARFRSALSDTFATVPRLQLCLLTGEQEGSWELEAAHTVWGRDVSTMFPAGDDAAGDADEVSAFGLFSGGGQSMQVCACCVARVFTARPLALLLRTVHGFAGGRAWPCTAVLSVLDVVQ